MRNVITILLFLPISLIYGQSSLLNKKVEINKSEGTIKELLVEISRSGNFTFSYSEDHINTSKNVKLKDNHQTIENYLNELFKTDNISYTELGNKIILKQSTELVKADSKFVIKGKVIDKKSKKGLLYAAIWIKGTSIGVMTDENGNFKFQIPEKYKDAEICISMLGYMLYTTKISKISSFSNLKFELEIDPIKIQEVVIDNTNALLVLQKVLNKVDKSIPKKRYSFNGFYREYTKINGKYTALLESAFTSFRKKKTRRTKKNMAITKIDGIRHSLNYNSNKRDWVKNYNYIFRFDVWAEEYAKNRFLDVKECTFTKCVTIKDGDKEQFLISFNYSTDHEYNGEIYIDKNTYHINKYHIISTSYNPNKPSKLVINEFGYPFQVKGLSLEFEYKEINKKIYIDYIRDIRKSIYVDTITGKIFENIETKKEYFVTDISVKSRLPFSINERMQYLTSLEHQGIAYDSAFWSRYIIPENAKLHNAVISDLEEKIPLSEQFKKSSLINVIDELKNAENDIEYEAIWLNFLKEEHLYSKNYEQFESYADTLIQHKKYLKAENILDHLVKNRYREPWPLLTRGDLYLQMNELKLAYVDYNLFLKKMKKPYRRLKEIREIVKSKIEMIKKKAE